MNSDAERRQNAQNPGSINYKPDTNVPTQPITPVSGSIAAVEAIDKTLPDLTGEARQYAQQQLGSQRISGR